MVKYTSRDELEQKYGQLMLDCEYYMENSIETTLNYLDNVRNNGKFYEAKEVVNIVLGNLENCIESLIEFEKEISDKAFPETEERRKNVILEKEEEKEEKEDKEGKEDKEDL